MATPLEEIGSWNEQRRRDRQGGYFEPAPRDPVGGPASNVDDVQIGGPAQMRPEPVARDAMEAKWNALGLTILGDNRALAEQRAAQPEPDEPNALQRGWEQLKTAGQAAVTAPFGIGQEGLAESIAEDATMQQARQYTPEEEQWQADIAQQSKEAEEAEGFWNTAGEYVDVAGAALSNLPALGSAAAESLPMMLPSLGAGAAGALAGSAFSPVGTLIGGLIGMTAGTFGTDFGAEYAGRVQEEAAKRGLNPNDKAAVASVLGDEKFNDDALPAAAKHAGAVAGTDLAVMALTGGLGSKAGRTLKRGIDAAAKARGVNPADDVAMAALKSSPEFMADIKPSVEAYRKATSLPRRAGRNVALMGLETAGEGGGEALGQYLADGEIDAGDVVLESLLGGGMSMAQVAAGSAYGKAAGRQTMPGVVEDFETLEKGAQDLRAGEEAEAGAFDSGRAAYMEEDAVIGEQLRAEQTARSRQAEMEAAGFPAVQPGPMAGTAQTGIGGAGAGTGGWGIGGTTPAGQEAPGGMSPELATGNIQGLSSSFAKRAQQQAGIGGIGINEPAPTAAVAPGPSLRGRINSLRTGRGDAPVIGAPITPAQQEQNLAGERQGAAIGKIVPYTDATANERQLRNINGADIDLAYNLMDQKYGPGFAEDLKTRREEGEITPAQELAIQEPFFQEAKRILSADSAPIDADTQRMMDAQGEAYTNLKRDLGWSTETAPYPTADGLEADYAPGATAPDLPANLPTGEVIEGEQVEGVPTQTTDAFRTAWDSSSQGKRDQLVANVVGRDIPGTHEWRLSLLRSNFDGLPPNVQEALLVEAANNPGALPTMVETEGAEITPTEQQTFRGRRKRAELQGAEFDGATDWEDSTAAQKKIILGDAGIAPTFKRGSGSTTQTIDKAAMPFDELTGVDQAAILQAYQETQNAPVRVPQRQGASGAQAKGAAGTKGGVGAQPKGTTRQARIAQRKQAAQALKDAKPNAPKSLTKRKVNAKAKAATPKASKEAPSAESGTATEEDAKAKWGGLKSPAARAQKLKDLKISAPKRTTWGGLSQGKRKQILDALNADPTVLDVEAKKFDPDNAYDPETILSNPDFDRDTLYRQRFRSGNSERVGSGYGPEGDKKRMKADPDQGWWGYFDQSSKPKIAEVASTLSKLDPSDSMPDLTKRDRKIIAGVMKAMDAEDKVKRQEEAARSETAGDVLTQPTPEDLAERQRQIDEAKAAESKAENKQQIDAETADFTLTGLGNTASQVSPNNEEIPFSFTERDRKPARSVDPAELKQRMGEVTGKWKGLGNVDVVATENDLPAAQKAKAKAMRAKGAEGVVQAVYIPGATPQESKIILVAENIGDMKEAGRKLAHEAVGHHGLRMTFPDARLDPLLNEVADTFENERAFQGIVDNYKLDMKTEAGRLEAADEYIAHLAETKPNDPILKRIYAAIRAAIRAAGFNVSLRDVDLNRILRNNLQAVQRGTKTGSTDAKARGEYAFAGPKSVTADQTTLKEAKALDKIGAPDEAIRRETGWSKGADKKWRYEIDDSKAKLKTDDSVVHGKLGDVLDHPELFSAYPELAEKVWVNGQHSPAIDSTTGSLQKIGESIGYRMEASGKSPDEMLSAILHETQHGIQNVEGFAGGGNTRLFKAGSNRADLQNMTRDEYQRGDAKKFSDAADKAMADGEQEKALRLLQKAEDAAAFQAYLRLAGETEARNVQTRQGMSAEDRDLVSPRQTQDTADAEQIVINDEGEAMLEGPRSYDEPEARFAFGRKSVPPNSQNPGKGFGMPSQKKWVDKHIDSFKYHIVDRFKDVTDLQKEIGPLPEDQDAAMAIEGFSGRSRSRLDDIDDFHVRPILKAVSDNGYKFEEVGEYLHARHAPSANAELKSRNPDLATIKARQTQALKERDQILADKKKIRKAKPGNYPTDKDYRILQAAHKKVKARLKALGSMKPRDDNEALSGMTDAEANKIVAQYNGTPMEDIGAQIDAMQAEHRKKLVEDGLVTQEEIDSWNSIWQNYVPLHRQQFDTEGEPLPDMPGAGSGFQIKGKEYKVRGGSNMEVDHSLILPHIIVQSEMGAVRGEKNSVGQTMYNLVKNNPDPKFWDLNGTVTQKSLGKDGTMKYKEVLDVPNSIGVKIDGKQEYITFNRDNPKAQRLLKEMANIQGREMPNFLRGVHTVMRYLSMVNTSLSPEFVLTNLGRDLQTAAYNLSSTEAKGLQRRILKDAITKAIPGMWKNLRHKHDTEWSKYADEFKRAGGMVGWMDNYEGIEDRLKGLQNEMKEVGKGYSSRKAFVGLGNFIGDMNGAMENAVRLSAYVHSRKIGLSERKAASIAKNLTVNFNRKGASSQYANLAYLFFNASVQGSARMITALRTSPAVRKMVGTTVLAAAAIEVMNRAISGVDDDGERYYDKIPDHVKERNMIFVYGSGPKDFMLIPLPWGYNVFHTMGQKLGRAWGQVSGDEVKGYSVASEAGDILSSVASAFNPIHSGSVLQSLSPTLLDPAVKIAENKDWHGGPLMPNQNPFGPPKPNAESYFASATEPAKGIAKFLNETVSNGNEVRPGWWDWSPEWLDMVWSDATGSAGRFALNTADTAIRGATGEPIEEKNIPFRRKFFGREYPSQDYEKYYRNKNDLDMLSKELKLFRGTPEFAELKRGNMPKIRLIRRLKVAERQMSRLRKQKRKLQVDRPKDPRIKVLDDQIRARMKAFNLLYSRAVPTA